MTQTRLKRTVGVAQSSTGGSKLADVNDAVIGGGQGPIQRGPRRRTQQGVVNAFVLLLRRTIPQPQEVEHSQVNQRLGKSTHCFSASRTCKIREKEESWSKIPTCRNFALGFVK